MATISIFEAHVKHFKDTDTTGISGIAAGVAAGSVHEFANLGPALLHVFAQAIGNIEHTCVRRRSLKVGYKIVEAM